jgi:hypothetical protein
VRHRKITRRGGIDIAAEVEARKESPMTDTEYREWQRSRATLEQRERDRQIEAERSAEAAKFLEEAAVETGQRMDELEAKQTYAERLAAWNAKEKQCPM